MNVSSTIAKFGLTKAFRHLYKDPENNLPQLMDWADKFSNGIYPSQRAAVREAIEDPDNAYYPYIRHLINDVDPDVLTAVAVNFFINENLIGGPIQDEWKEKYQCNIPWAILLDPTSACNLHCVGCWAAEYGNKLNLSFDEIDDIVRQGKEMGVYMYIYTGGEPLVRKKDLIRICEKHDDCIFLAFTNGTLIDEAFADEMLRVKNFVPAISIEGFEEATDSRRGKGTYAKVIAAMEQLRARRLLFGISCCYTSANVEVIGSEEYFDAMIDMGAKFAWMFTYIPIGADAVPELIATAEQRKFMYEKIHEYRQTKPLFTMDFWNDGDAVGGCIAGGRGYCHINANGDMEPCAFIHYSNANIKEQTLLECYQSPLFMEYRKNQPFNENMLRPCPVLDNPGRLTEMVAASGAHSTDLACPEQACDYCNRCVPAAERWATVADELWENLPNKRGTVYTGKMAKKG